MHRQSGPAGRLRAVARQTFLQHGSVALGTAAYGIGAYGIGSLALAVLATVLFGIGTATEIRAEEPAVASLNSVPSPDLLTVEPAVRGQLEQAQAGLEQLVSQADASTEELALAFGGLGQIYFLYGLDSSASEVFENAHQLAPLDFRWPYYLGVLAQERQNLDLGRQYLGASLELKPDYLPALVRSGRIELSHHRATEAIPWFERVLALEPEAAPGLAGLGQAAWMTGNFEQAVGYLRRALELDPQASALHYQLAMAYRDLGRLDEAKAEMKLRGTSSTTFADPLIDSLGALAQGSAFHTYYGAKASQFGDLDGAVSRYRKALEMDPENLIARTALSSALIQAQDPDAARRELEIIVANAPDNVAARIRLGSTLLLAQDTAGALEHFETAVRLAPDYPEAQIGLATALESLGRSAEAEAHCRRSLELDPTNLTARLQLARLLTMSRRYDEAEVQIRLGLAVDPENTDALLGLATVHRRAGDLAAAKDDYELLLARAEEAQLQGLAHLELGRLAMEQGDLDYALPHLQAASNQLTGMSELHLTLANMLGREGRFEEAGRQFDLYVEAEPGDQAGHFGRALAYMMGGLDREALERLEQSTEMVPGNQGLEHALARLLAASSDSAVRDGERALALAQQIFQAQQNLDYAETLAMAWAETGRFDEAIRWQERILEQAARMGAEQRLPALQRRLDAYRRGEPCRTPWLEGS